jgi:hypothetical protein
MYEDFKLPAPSCKKVPGLGNSPGRPRHKEGGSETWRRFPDFPYLLLKALNYEQEHSLLNLKKVVI